MTYFKNNPAKDENQNSVELNTIQEKKLLRDKLQNAGGFSHEKIEEIVEQASFPQTEKESLAELAESEGIIHKALGIPLDDKENIDKKSDEMIQRIIKTHGLKVSSLEDPKKEVRDKIKKIS